MIPGIGHFYTKIFSAKVASAARLRLFLWALPGAAGLRCRGLGADCTPSPFGLEGKLYLQKGKGEVLTRVPVRNVLPACKMILSRKIHGTWRLNCLSRNYLCSSISSWSLGCCKGKNKSRGNMQIAARLTSLFSSLVGYGTGKSSSSAMQNPWILELLLQHPFQKWEHAAA